jgi:glycyl-tRNA synthetase beta subunit
MDLKELDLHFENLSSKDDKVRYPSFKAVHAETNNEVLWIYDKWPQLVEKLSSDNSFQRSIGALLLLNLVKSDKENKVYQIIDKLINVAEDEKFITARLCLQNLWKAAIKNPDLLKKVSEFLETTYYENVHLNSHANLIKQDAFLSLTEIYKKTGDAKVKTIIDNIFNTETDEKIKKVLKKYK